MATILVIGMHKHEEACTTGLIPRPPYHSHWLGNEVPPTLIDPGATSAFPVSRLAVLCTLRLRYLFNTEEREKELHVLFSLASFPAHPHSSWMRRRNNRLTHSWSCGWWLVESIHLLQGPEGSPTSPAAHGCTMYRCFEHSVTV